MGDKLKTALTEVRKLAQLVDLVSVNFCEQQNVFIHQDFPNGRLTDVPAFGAEFHKPIKRNDRQVTFAVQNRYAGEQFWKFGMLEGDGNFEGQSFETDRMDDNNRFGYSEVFVAHILTTFRGYKPPCWRDITQRPKTRQVIKINNLQFFFLT